MYLDRELPRAERRVTVEDEDEDMDQDDDTLSGMNISASGCGVQA
jgi:hypothetical protein